MESIPSTRDAEYSRCPDDNSVLLEDSGVRRLPLLFLIMGGPSAKCTSASSPSGIGAGIASASSLCRPTLIRPSPRRRSASRARASYSQASPSSSTFAASIRPSSGARSHAGSQSVRRRQHTHDKGTLGRRCVETGSGWQAMAMDKTLSWRVRTTTSRRRGDTPGMSPASFASWGSGRWFLAPRSPNCDSGYSRASMIM